jgi:CRISPR-associated endonuclease Cas3-HD
MKLDPKWLSHGVGSSLMEHTAQVLAMGETFAERVAAICHDVGKATIPWQERAKRNFHYPDGAPIPSPHSHAEWGGVFAYFILEELGTDLVTKTAVLQTVAAHHSQLGTVETRSEIVSAIADSTEALEFAAEAFNTFLPQISMDTVKKAWMKARKAFSEGEIESLFNDKDFSDADKLRLILSSRRMLAKLVLFDTRSAANQDQKTRKPFLATLPSGPVFTKRPKRLYQQNRLSSLRDSLKQACLSMPPSLFYSIEAPTGIGKTESMLSLAEKVVTNENKQAIVYAVPQISICEQIVADYMAGADAQVWNFKTKQKIGEGSNVDDQDTKAAVLESQFSSSYNITTFNQVVLSIAHPHRNHCVRSLWLKNAVIIMDEVHKLPLHCLLYFIQLVKLYAEQNDCTWIFGSATPLPDSKKIFRDIQVSKIDERVSSTFRDSPVLYSRRVYQKIEDQDSESIADMISRFAKAKEQNLVLLSLVEKGTFAVAKLVGIPTDPWNRIFTALNPDHPVIWLDGSVPPLLREGYLSFVKDRLNGREPVTLLTTQVVEAGVDLDFETGFTDLISLASTLQRGGRVAREARADSRPRTVHLFDFRILVSDCGQQFEKTTKEILDSVALDSLNLTKKAKEKIQMLLCNTQSKIKQYFDRWTIGEIRQEIELLQTNSEITAQELDAIRDPSISDIVTLDFQHSHLGLTLQYLETITRLYSDEPTGESVILFETAENLTRVRDLFTQERERLGYQEVAKRRVTIHKNLVESLKAEGFYEVAAPFWADQSLVKANHII